MTNRKHYLNYIIVGDGATLVVGSDRYPYTVHKVKGSRVWVSADSCSHNKKQWPEQDYDYTNDKQSLGEEFWTIFSLRKNGHLIRKGDSGKGCALYVGKRQFYHDPSY